MKNIRPQLNEEIFAKEMVVIDENAKSLGVVSYDQAMLLASDKGLDLMIVNPNANPPIAKFVDFSKEQYRKEKLKRKQKARQKFLETKEIKLGINIGDHDLDTKVRKAKELMKKGHKIKVLIILRGREMLFANKTGGLIERFTDLIEGKFEQAIKREGNRFFATIVKK